MTAPSSYEAQFLAHLPWMRRAMAALCRRHRLDGADAEDCASWSLLRLLEHDYAILRKFRGESTLQTYLGVVLVTLNREYRVEHWGRWRPSAAARRLGPVAELLERLVYRDGCRHDEAIQVVRLTRADGAGDCSERELVALLAALPVRPVRGECELTEELPDTSAAADAESLVLDTESRDEMRQLQTAIAGALATLPHEDREMVRMQYWDGMSVADIARARRVPQKPLYRRLARALRSLRSALEAAGVSRRRTRALLDRTAA